MANPFFQVGYRGAHGSIMVLPEDIIDQWYSTPSSSQRYATLSIIILFGPSSALFKDILIGVTHMYALCAHQKRTLQFFVLGEDFYRIILYTFIIDFIANNLREVDSSLYVNSFPNLCALVFSRHSASC